MKINEEVAEPKLAEQNAPEQPQKLKVKLLLNEWEAVLSVIENSTSAYIEVKSVAAELVKQLQPQVKTDDK